MIKYKNILIPFCLVILIIFYEQYNGVLFEHFYYLKNSFGIVYLLSSFNATERDMVYGDSAPFFNTSYIIHFFKSPIVIAYFLIVTFLTLLNRKRLGWDNFGLSKWTRYFFIVILAVFGWVYALYDYNYFFDQFHLLERVSLLLVILFCWFSPVAILYFLPLMMVSMSQFSYPFNLSLTDTLLPLNILMMMGTWTLIHMLTAIFTKRFKGLGLLKMVRDYRQTILLSGILVIVAASYIKPFFTKLNLGSSLFEWLEYEKFDIAIKRYDVRGWLDQFLSDDWIIWIVDLMGTLGPAFLLLTLIFQGFGFFIFLNDRFMRISLFLWFGFHFLVFALTGIFFWKWMFVLVLIFMWTWNDKTMLRPIYENWKSKLAFTAVIILCFGCVQTTYLGWLYTSYSTFYRMEGHGKDGKSYSIQPKDITPNDMFLTFNLRWKLNSGKVIPAAVSSVNEFKKVEEGVDLRNWRTAIDSRGADNYSEEFEINMRDFMIRVFGARNRHAGNSHLL